MKLLINITWSFCWCVSSRNAIRSFSSNSILIFFCVVEFFEHIGILKSLTIDNDWFVFVRVWNIFNTSVDSSCFIEWRNFFFPNLNLEKKNNFQNLFEHRNWFHIRWLQALPIPSLSQSILHPMLRRISLYFNGCLAHSW